MSRKPDLIDLLINKIEFDPHGCWIWTGAIDAGYGRIKIAGRRQGAHRAAYEALVGPIPTGLVIDHLCRVPRCINPDHLEPVTHRENTLRGVGPSALHAVKTHCPASHEYNEANTYMHNGIRHCRPCHREREARRRASKRQASASTHRAEPNAAEGVR